MWSMYEITMASGAVDHAVAESEADAGALAAKVRSGDTVSAVRVLRSAEWGECHSAITDRYVPLVAAAAVGADRDAVKAQRQAEYDAARAVCVAMEQARIEAEALAAEEVAL
jgi:hypothetical protein